jgi:protein involved in plasmid replication-relaxation
VSVAQRRRSFPRVGAEVLEGLYTHRLLSTWQLQALLMPGFSRRWADQVLQELTAAGLVQSVNRRARGGERLHYLTPGGLETVESAPHLEPRRVQVTEAGAAGTLQAHTLAVNDVGVAFVTAARARGDECGPLSWRHEIAHPIGPGAGRGAKGGDLVIADAVLRYTQFGDSVDLHTRFIELDRATMPLEDLASKLRRYARLHAYVPEGSEAPGWTQLYPYAFPEVLLVLAGKERSELERRRDTVLAIVGQDAQIKATNGILVIACALLEDLMASGPFAPVFVRHDNPHTFVDWLGHG